MYRQHFQIQEFAEKVGVSRQTITNVFAGEAPRYEVFLEMLSVLKIQIQFKTDLDLQTALKKAFDEAKSIEEAILFVWRNLAKMKFLGETETEIQREIARTMGKPTQVIKNYWNATNYPRLDSLIALFAAVNVELVLATEKEKLPTLIDKPKNLN